MALFNKDKKIDDRTLYRQDDELEGILDDDIKAELRGQTDIKGNKEKTAEDIQREIENYELAKLEREMEVEKFKETRADKFKEYASSLFTIVPAVQSLIYFFIFFFMSAIYVNILSGNLVLSVIISIPFALLMFHYFVYLPARLERHQNNLQNLMSYANSMVFYMQSGDNITNALIKTKRSVKGDVRVDIQRTLNKLEENAITLDTSSFNRHKFRNIDVFNQILLIKHIEGGSDIKAMFNNVLKFISFEIIKRDELHRGKKSARTIIMMMIAMGLSVPLSIAYMSKEQYEMFLANPYSQYMIVVYVIILVWNMCATQKATCDIDVD